jgi:hypothetical protein
MQEIRWHAHAANAANAANAATINCPEACVVIWVRPGQWRWHALDVGG